MNLDSSNDFYWEMDAVLADVDSQSYSSDQGGRYGQQYTLRLCLAAILLLTLSQTEDMQQEAIDVGTS